MYNFSLTNNNYSIPEHIINEFNELNNCISPLVHNYSLTALYSIILGSLLVLWVLLDKKNTEDIIITFKEYPIKYYWFVKLRLGIAIYYLFYGLDHIIGLVNL